VKSPLAAVLTGFALYSAVIVAMSLLWEREQALLGVLLAIVALTLALYRSRRLTVFFFVGAILGPLAESFAIRAGAWTYGGIEALFPLWLPPAWGLAALLMVVIVDGCLSLWPGDHGSR